MATSTGTRTGRGTRTNWKTAADWRNDAEVDRIRDGNPEVLDGRDDMQDDGKGDTDRNWDSDGCGKPEIQRRPRIREMDRENDIFEHEDCGGAEVQREWGQARDGKPENRRS